MDDVEGSVEPEVDATLTDAAVESEDAPVEAVVEASDEVEGEEDFSSWTVEDAVARLKETRQEAAKYRTDRNRFRDAFEGYDDDTVDAYLQAVRAIQTDPAAAHEAFSGLVAALAEAAGISAEEAEELVEDSLGDDELVKKSDLAKLLAEEQDKKEKEEAAAVARKEVDDHIASLGYRPNTADFNNLLFFATQEEEGSVTDKLNAAHAQLQAQRQAIIDEFLASEAAKENSTPPQTDGASPSPVRPVISSIKDGAKGARAALDAMFSEA